MPNNESYQQELRERGIRQKQLDGIVTAAVAQVLSEVKTRQPSLHSHHFYGASAIHPKHLVTWFVFKTDADLESARGSGLTGDIDAFTRRELGCAGYPNEGIPLIKVAFTSDEDVQRTAGGNYWLYFK